jgi:hypothetical protein
VSAGYAAAFVRTRAQARRPDAQIYFINFSTARRGGVLHSHSGFTCSVSQLQVESRGSVRIRSADPAAPPAIRYNYLATENDRRVMVDGLKLVRRIVNTPPMRDYVIDEFLPGPQVRSDEDWLAFCREAGDTVFHPSSTCSIGSVVDEELRVKGVSSLRVIDASVMPAVPSGNINAAVIALAEKGADLIKAGARLAHDVVGPHHLVLLVLEDVAVVDVAEFLPRARASRARQVVARDDARYRLRIADHRVLPRRPLVVLRRLRRLVEDDRRILVDVEMPPLEDLELHQVDVDRVRVPGGVD